MFQIAAIISFAISVIFYVFSIHHDIWTWTLFMLIGLFCWAFSGVRR